MSGRVLAVGDIHGQLERLLALLAKLEIRPEEDELVFLGDYIDRGPDSRGVVEELIRLASSGVRAAFLKGNHEAMLLDFLAGRNQDLYLLNGGRATLKSYARPGQDELEARPPREHLDFFQNLRLHHRAGGRLFVHAGLRPGVPLEEQTERDLLWIREEFYLADHDWPEPVVFGHTPFPDPWKEGRLYGIDSGAGYGGPLTCLVLPGEEIIQA